MKQTGKRSAGNLHAAFEEAGTGNGAKVLLVRHSYRKPRATDIPNLKSPRQSSTLPSVPVRNGPRKQIRKGYLWVYIDVDKNVAFDYTPTRAREGPVEFLGDYSGYIQADAYAGYDAVFEKGFATEVGCWAHGRRKFYDAKDTDPARGHEMLALIRQLYQIEAQAKEQQLDAVGVKALRQEYSKPILDKIEQRLAMFSLEVLPKSPMAEAVGYARGQWQALNRYLEDGILDIGRVERWRGGLGFGLPLCQGFPVRGAISACHAPSPPPAPRTGRADFPHPALLQNLRPSLSAQPRGCWAVRTAPAFRRDRRRGTVCTPYRPAVDAASAIYENVVPCTGEPADKWTSPGLD